MNIQEIERVNDTVERLVLHGELEKLTVSKHEKILIGNALQVYIDHNEAMLKDGYALGEGIFIMEKSIAEAKELINKFKEW